MIRMPVRAYEIYFDPENGIVVHISEIPDAVENTSPINTHLKRSEKRTYLCPANPGHESFHRGLVRRKSVFHRQKREKKYAYHPNHDLLALCIGNGVDHLCPNGSDQFRIDSRDPQTACPKCHSEEISDTFDLGGKPCSWCKAGNLRRDSDYIAIS